MPKITAITQQKRNSRRWSIFIDKKFFAGCSEDMVVALGLRRGLELSVEDIAELREKLGVAKVRQRALDYLSRRGRSEKEMRDYLKRKSYEAKEIESAINWLIERKYIDDRQFAADWVRGRLAVSPRGRRKLLLELYQKGVSREIAEREVDSQLKRDDEAEAAYKTILSRRGRYLKLEKLDIKRKIYNFLSYRGFSPDAVREACERFLREEVE